VIEGVALPYQAHLFVQTTHHRIGLLIGHKVPEGGATEKGWLIATGHKRFLLQCLDYRAKKFSGFW